MKKILCLTLCLLSVNALAQGVLSRVTDADHMKVVFIEKGNRALGIAGSYWSFNAGGDVVGDGYAVMSLLNIGSGKYATYYVAPKFSYFIGNDLSLDARLEYSGYTLNTDLRLDLRNAVDLKEIAGDDPKLMDELNELLNLRISGRHMVRNAWGGSLALRKYISFFGSQTFAVFGEARLYGNVGRINSCPIDEAGKQLQAQLRTTNTFSVGLKIGGGLCVRLPGCNFITVSVPLVGVAYDNTQQYKAKTNNNAHLSQFKVARNLDFMGIMVAYSHFIKSKKK